MRINLDPRERAMVPSQKYADIPNNGLLELLVIEVDLKPHVVNLAFRPEPVMAATEASQLV